MIMSQEIIQLLNSFLSKKNFGIEIKNTSEDVLTMVVPDGLEPSTH